MSPDPHGKCVVRTAGVPMEKAIGAVILLHGRGGSSEDILSLVGAIELPRLIYLAPQASGNTWYPKSFLAPIAENQPWLSSALGKVESLIELLYASGIGADRVAIGGFSQGACLATQYVAGHPRRYAGLFALTGGLMGPLGGELTRGGDLKGMPAFLGSSDPDPHVPWNRVQQSAAILEEMGANVTLKRYEGRGHAVNAEELEFVRRLLNDALPSLS